MYSFLPAYFIGGIMLITIGALHLSVPFFVLYYFQLQLGWRRALLTLPLLWPVWEWFFLQSKLSMPLSAFYHTQAPMTWLIQYIDIFGYNSISSWLILLNVLLVFTIDDYRSIISKSHIKNKHAIINWINLYVQPFLVKRLLTIFAIMFVIPLLYNAYVHTTLPDEIEGSVKVSLVQLGYSPKEENNDSTYSLSMEQYVLMTDSLVSNDTTDLIVWPEVSIPYAIMHTKPVRDYIFMKVLEWNTPLLAGVLDIKTFKDSSLIPPLQKYIGRDYEIYNSAVMITPQLAWRYLKEDLDITSLKIYRKQNLMPFTEYVPFSEDYPILSSLTIDLGNGANFSSGESPKSLLFAAQDEQVINVSPIICWDLLYPSSGIEKLEKGKNFIAALTNESRLGKSSTTTAHEMEGFTRLRSIESRRSIAKCSATGYSLFTDQFGSIYGKVPWWSKQIATANIKLSNTITIFNQYPGYFPKACLITLVLLFLFTIKKRKRAWDKNQLNQ